MSERDHLKPISYGHGRRGSIDTNASAIAESTISLRLSSFPEPPSSTPSTPLRSEFGGTPLPTRTNFPQSTHSNSPGRSNLSSLHATSRSRSFKPNSTQHTKDNLPGSSQTPSAYDSNGTSTIDVDTAETVSSTSFTPALPQVNKDQRRIERDAMSGITEMTCPPLDTDNALFACNSSGGPLTSHIPPPASMQARKRLNRISGDSESLQGHTPIIRTASVSRSVFKSGASVVGFAPATLCNVSGTCSTVDLLSDKSLHRSTYEFSDDLSDSRTFDSLSSFFPRTGTRGGLRGKPAEPHFEARVVDPASTSLLSRISGISLRSWKKNKPLPDVPGSPRTTGYTHRHEESVSLSELISRAVALGELLGKDQNSHSDVLSSRLSAPHSVQGTGGSKPETISMAAASLSHTFLSPNKPLPAATAVFATSKKKRIFFLIFFLLIVALAAIGAGVGVSAASRQKQRLPACAGNFTGVACNLGR